MEKFNKKFMEARWNESLQLHQLDHYAFGDPKLRTKLIELIIDNMLELQRSLRLSNEKNDDSIFHRACHKVTTSITILDHMLFTTIINELKRHGSDPRKNELFNQLCDWIIKCLLDERDKPLHGSNKCTADTI